MLVSRDQITKRFAVPDTLTHSGGVITAIFNNTSYPTTLSGLSATTLYFLYLRTSGGITQLFVSTAVPSVYRISFPEAILVGAFYSNGITGSVGFGSFVNIQGVPNTDVFPTTITGSWIANTVHAGNMQITGDMLELEVKSTCSGAPTVAQYLINMPTGFIINTAKTNSNTENVSGHASALDATTVYLGQSAIFTSTQIFVRVWLSNGTYAVHSDITSSSPFAFGASDQVYFKIRIPIVGLTNTSLKDL